MLLENDRALRLGRGPLVKRGPDLQTSRGRRQTIKVGGGWRLGQDHVLLESFFRVNVHDIGGQSRKRISVHHHVRRRQLAVCVLERRYGGRLARRRVEIIQAQRMALKYQPAGRGQGDRADSIQIRAEVHFELATDGRRAVWCDLDEILGIEPLAILQ